MYASPHSALNVDAVASNISPHTPLRPTHSLPENSPINPQDCHSTDNYHVFPEYAVNLLAPTVFIVPIPLEAVCLITPAMSHILVSVAIRHRIYRVASSPNSSDDVAELRSKFYGHRQKAMTALNEEIRVQKNVYSLMISAILFVFAEVRLSCFPEPSRRNRMPGAGLD